MGVGTASGEKRAEEAAKAAINSPLIDISIHGAKGVLFSIAGGDDLTMFEIQDAAKVITESIDPNAKVIFGTVRDSKLKKNEIKVTVIASGFPEQNIGQNKKSLFGNNNNTENTRNKDFETERNTEKSDRAGKIYNTITPPITQNKPLDRNIHTEEKKNDLDDSDDDWGAIPAFLRRSKIK
jgi:cell division protein FtsZ